MEKYRKSNEKISNYKNKYKKQEEEKFDIEKWIKQHQNIEQPKRSKKNSLGDKKK